MVDQQQWDSAISSYLTVMKSAGVGNSLRAQRSRYLQRLRDVCGDHGPWDVTTEQLVEFVGGVSCRGSRNSRKLATDAVRSFYAWGEQRGSVAENPAVSALIEPADA